MKSLGRDRTIALAIEVAPRRGSLLLEQRTIMVSGKDGSYRSVCISWLYVVAAFGLSNNSSYFAAQWADK